MPLQSRHPLNQPTINLPQPPKRRAQYIVEGKLLIRWKLPKSSHLLSLLSEIFSQTKVKVNIIIIKSEWPLPTCTYIQYIHEFGIFVLVRFLSHTNFLFLFQSESAMENVKIGDGSDAKSTLVLPHELSEKILEFLSPSDLSRFSMCCIEYRELANSNHLWFVDDFFLYLMFCMHAHVCLCYFVISFNSFLFEVEER